MVVVVVVCACACVAGTVPKQSSAKETTDDTTVKKPLSSRMPKRASLSYSDWFGLASSNVVGPSLPHRLVQVTDHGLLLHLYWRVPQGETLRFSLKGFTLSLPAKHQ